MCASVDADAMRDDDAEDAPDDRDRHRRDDHQHRRDDHHHPATYMTHRGAAHLPDRP